MRQIQPLVKRHTWWLLSLLAVFVLCLLAMFAPQAQAESGQDTPALAQQPLSGQVFNENLTVADGEVYEDDVTVTAGNVLVEDGGRIEGNLIVWSGNIEIRDGGEVEGDVSALAGNVMLAGVVGGDVSALSGNVELKETASVDGDVSVMSGNILRARGAEIDGNVVQGPAFRMPRPFSGWFGRAPAAPELPGTVMQTRTSFWGWLGGLVLRLILAVLFTVIVVVLTTVLFNIRPDLIQPLRRVMIERTAYSFVVGLIVNLLLGVITAGMIATLCLAPIGLFSGLVLLALNLVGWTVASQFVGERLAGYVRTPMQPVASLALGALLLTGAVAFLWALGGCLRPIANLTWLLVSSFGVGAAIVHWLKLDGRTSVAVSPAPVEPAAPSSGAVRVYTPVERPQQGDVSRDNPITPVVAPSSFSEPSTPAPEITPPAPVIEEDLTVIRGIGPSSDQRLKAAGIRTFAQLAALTPEQLAAIIGIPLERVIEDDLIGQARRLAEERSE
jgi:predicted flap endonuclease-1-like 5' DNA nuclease/cytoskeletal protein CcmA (bactofilin family)